MQIALLIAALVAPALLAYKHNQQAQHMLEGRLHGMGLDQSPARQAFRNNRPLLKSNLLIVLGADLGIAAMFLHSFLTTAALVAALIVGAAIVVLGVVWKAKVISTIHRSLLGR